MIRNLSDIRNRALNLLARREHSATELYHKLKMRNYDKDSIKSVVEMLGKEGLQSDNRFTENYIHSRVEKGYGPIRIMKELRERGINDDLIFSHLDTYDPEWVSRAHRVRVKRFGNILPKNFKEKARQLRFLQQRGFSGDLIRNIFNAGDD